MEKSKNYSDFLKERGKKLKISEEFYEIALIVKDAIVAIDILKEKHTPIIGGDILTLNKNGDLIYAYQSWGSEYHYLNWSCDKLEVEGKEEYLKRSHNLAYNSINNAANIAEKLEKDCYIIFVI